MAPNLEQVQRWLHWVFTNPHRPVDALKTPRGEPTPRCLDYVENKKPIDRFERLEIYTNAYFSRLVGSLRNNFPKVARYLETLEEENSFTLFCVDYLKAYPSQGAQIEGLGKHFSEFIAFRSEGSQFPFLSDLARLEWAFGQAIFRSALPILDPKRMEAIAADDWGQLHPQLDPTVTLIQSNWPLTRLWEVEAEDPLPKVRRKKTWLLVYRDPSNEICVESIEKNAYRLLQAFAKGRALEKALKPGMEDCPLQEWFGKWVGRGVIRDLV